MGEVPQNQTVVVVVLDALGKRTLEHYLDTVSEPVSFPNIAQLGLGNILDPRYHDRVPPASQPDCALALEPASFWSDSVMGHRELLGFVDPTRYELFYNGFPRDYLTVLQARVRESTGVARPVLYNQRAGGMEAIEQNHAEHVRTGGLVVYASMCDPLVQIAACEDVIPPDELNLIAQLAFDCAREQGVNLTRVISRPYVVREQNGTVEYIRTAHRRDIVIPLPSGVKTFIDVARYNSVLTASVGKCADVVNTDWDIVASLPDYPSSELDFMYTSPKRKDKNPYSIDETLCFLRITAPAEPRFIMCNLPDTDSLFGHNRDVRGAVASVRAFDQALPLLLAALPERGYLIVTADHGMEDRGDYGYHGREAVPVLAVAKDGRRISDLVHLPAVRSSYGVVGYIAAQLFGFGREYVERCNLQSHMR